MYDFLVPTRLISYILAALCPSPRPLVTSSHLQYVFVEYPSNIAISCVISHEKHLSYSHRLAMVELSISLIRCASVVRDVLVCTASVISNESKYLALQFLTNEANHPLKR